MQDSGKKCFLALKVLYTIQEDQSKLDTLLKESSCLWGKICIKVSCLTDVAGQNQLHLEQALCLKALSFWNGGFLVQLFINLPRACQGLLPPVQCHLQAYVGRTPCVHQMHAKFERLNSWSPPFFSRRMMWKHEGCSCHEGVTL